MRHLSPWNDCVFGQSAVTSSRRFLPFSRWLIPLILSIAFGSSFGAELRIGVAARDITPDYPVRLNGFGFRRDESSGVKATRNA